MNLYAMLMFNYITCVVLGFLMLPEHTLQIRDGGAITAIVMGAVNGGLYFASLALNQINVKRNGAILQSTFSRLGVLVPAIASIIFFGERPTILQVLGIAVFLVAILLLYHGNKQGRSEVSEVEKPAILLLVMGMFFGGLADFMSKIFEQVGQRNYDSWFVVITFFFALVITVVLVVTKRTHFGMREALIGVGVGVPNLLSTRLLLAALTSVPAYIAYPIYSVGGILIVMLVGSALFREKLDKWAKWSVALIVLTIVLLNL